MMLIAGVSTVLFNANPLLRFDGYYMLAGLAGDPEPAHTRRRSTSPTCASSYLFGRARMPSRRTSTPGERVWFVALLGRLVLLPHRW